MSFPIYADIDKSAVDSINDDFDSKYSLKIKSAGPFGVTVTTNTTYNAKDNKLAVKLSGKWAHPKGFSVDKLEISPDGKVVTETSLSNATPGLKLEFKGNDSDKADMSFTYSVPNTATITGEVDAINFSKASTTVSGGHGPYSGGVSADFKLTKLSLDSTSFGAGFGYTLPNLFAGVKAAKNFSEYKGVFSYEAAKNVTLLGLLNYSGKGTTTTLGAIYACNPKTTIKVKAASTGVINASVKQAFEKKFTVVGSAEIPSNFSGFKFGVNATLG